MLKQHDFKQPRNADKVQSELKTETEIESAGITALRFCVVIVRMLSDTGKSFYRWWSSRFKTKISSIFRIKRKLKHFRKETT